MTLSVWYVLWVVSKSASPRLFFSVSSFVGSRRRRRRLYHFLRSTGRGGYMLLENRKLVVELYTRDTSTRTWHIVLGIVIHSRIPKMFLSIPTESIPRVERVRERERKSWKIKLTKKRKIKNACSYRKLNIII